MGQMPTVLLVDNDPLQAFLRKSVLEGPFSDVQRVGDSAEALCLVEQPQFAANLGLVISGQHVTGIGGPAFVAELHLRMPWLPVLVLDHGSDAAEDYGAESVRFLAKPFTNRDMVAQAGQMLKQAQNERSAA
jgi:DNA-binding NtrC family response regulator